MTSISVFPDPKTSILRFLATGLRDAVVASEHTYLSLERVLGRSGGYLCRIARREKSIGHPDAHRLSEVLARSFDDLFEPDAPSAELLSAWRAGRIVAIDGDNARFWSKVGLPDEPDGCWEWQSSTNRQGYGQFNLIGNRPALASRLSYEFCFGPIPDGMSVLHRCDNPPCVRPDHFFLGTHTDNMRDMIDKGRQRFGPAKLTWEQVDAIRAAAPMTIEDRRQLAAAYGVSDETVKRILFGRAWVRR